MILSDKEIKKYLKEGKITITPKPDLKKQLSGASIDLRLGNEFRIFEHSQNLFIDPKKFSNYTKLVKISPNKSFIIHPGEFILGITLETIGIDNSLCAKIDGKSSVGRMGIIVHSTAGHVNPGWKGKLTLEISNIGPLPVILYPGMNICQLVFETLTSQASDFYRKKDKYRNQKSPQDSRIYKEMC